MIHKPGWTLQRTICNNVSMQLNSQWSKVPMGMLPLLRQAVNSKELEYTRNKENFKLKSNTRLFRELDSRAAAYTTPLMHQFLAASSAYSCATPDNRIKLHVEQLEIIQNKDNKLREEENKKIESIIEKSKNKLRETQNKIDSMNSKLNILRKKLQSERETAHKKRMSERVPGAVSEIIEERNSEMRESIYDSLRKSKKDSNGQNAGVGGKEKDAEAAASATSNLMHILEKNLREARKSVHVQKNFIEKIEQSKSTSNMRPEDK